MSQERAAIKNRTANTVGTLKQGCFQKGGNSNHLGMSTTAGLPELDSRKVEQIKPATFSKGTSNSFRNLQLELTTAGLDSSKDKWNITEVNCKDGINRRVANNSTSISREINSNRDARNSMDDNKS